MEGKKKAKQREGAREVDGEVGVCRCESEAWKETICNVDTSGWKVEETTVGESGRKKLGSGVILRLLVRYV